MKHLPPLFTIWMLTSVAGFAQSEQEALKANLDFEKLEWTNPWVNSTNAAGLATFSTLLPEFTSFSNATLHYDYATGEFRDPLTPPTYTNIGFQTKSIQKLDDLFLMGYFNYDLSNRLDAQWNGLYVTGSNPFFMADSVKGRFRSETFSAGMKIAYPVGKNQTIGLAMDYRVGRGAKSKDLRHNNHYNDFVIRPSWMLKLPTLTIGATVGWNRTRETISYSQVADGAQWFFFMNGNWFFQNEPFSSNSDNSRNKMDNAFDGYVQLQYNGKAFAVYNELGMELAQGNQYNSLSNNKQFGDVETTTIKNRLVIHAFENHQLSVGVQYRYGLGYGVLQEYLYDSIVNSYVWTTFDRLTLFESIESTQSVVYSYLSRRDGGMDIRWQIDAGLTLFQREQVFRELPLIHTQTLSTTEVFAAFNKNLKFGKSSIDVRPLLAYGTGDGIKNAIQGGTPNPTNTKQLTAEMEREFDALTCDRLRMQLMLRYSHTLGDAGRKAFAFVNYDFVKPFNDRFKNDNRSFLTFGVGLSF